MPPIRNKSITPQIQVNGVGTNGVPPSTNSTPTVALRKEIDTRLYPIDNISTPLLPLVVDIDSLTLDPLNAREHPERNQEVIRQSLSLYGQMKPIVVRKEGKIVIAGNGTLLAARALGWTKIAATIVDVTYIEAMGYGLADNRTAELATWNYQVHGKLVRMISGLGGDVVGWTSDEIDTVLTQSLDQIEDNTDINTDNELNTGYVSKLKGFTLKLSDEHSVIIGEVIDAVKSREGQDAKDWSIEDCLIFACMDWLEENLDGTKEAVLE